MPLLPTFSSASVPYTPRQQRLHLPIKAERPCLARPALRFAVCRVLPRSPAPTKPPPPTVLDPPAMEPTGANRRRREACDTPPDVHRPSLAPGSHLCAAVAWEAEPAERDLPPPSDYSRLPSPFAPVSIPLYSPRPPLFSPPLNRAPGRLNRWRREPPAPSCPDGQSLMKLLAILHLVP
jgi:hypothetical protein